MAYAKSTMEALSEVITSPDAVAGLRFISTKMYYKFHKHVLGSKMVCQCYTKLLNICIIVITVALICMLLSTAVDV